MMMWPSILADKVGGFWLPERASTIAPDVDNLFNFILWVCIFFSLLIFTLMIWFVWRYRYRPGNEGGGAAGHNNTLEITWTVIPTIICAVIYYWGFKGFMREAVDPPSAYEITAVGQMWKWSFVYPNGGTSSELHVPINKPVRIVLRSEDVLHALFIPVMRVKKDVVPGRYNRLWFTPTQLGKYDIYCASYCGTQHSTMHTFCVVDDMKNFKDFLDDIGDPLGGKPWIEGGKRLRETFGCAGCHTPDGTASTGPSWKDMFGSEVPLADGSTVKADENYVRESITEPAAKVHRGFQPVMPSFKGRLSDREIDAIIWYMKSISSHVPTDQMTGGNAIAPKKKKAE